jgi:activating signal cointegrator 1
MKALTICQPYAELIMRGQKLVENRKWSTNYRGPLLIHAGKSKSWLVTRPGETFEMEHGISLADMSFGAIIGITRLIDCVPLGKQFNQITTRQTIQKYPWLEDHRHAEGPYCWILGTIKRFRTPIPFRGRQGLFDVPRGTNPIFDIQEVVYELT